MTKIQQDFEYWTGTEKIVRFTVLDENAASVDLTGAGASWLLQDEPDSGSILLITTDDQITISGCTADVLIGASLTAGCAMPRLCYHQLSACGITNTPDVLAVGQVRVHRQLS